MWYINLISQYCTHTHTHTQSLKSDRHIRCHLVRKVLTQHVFIFSLAHKYWKYTENRI
jgi:hypothetical protein